ncbi:hypothetical protein LEP1GSC202_0359 [Leptospira yanagawae serovar Saopaulo str. Sao Paulo = ATCC 700523]|uniref:Uncharacterized protein n=1 Tax=Leptospira yanagawae serovar Saopaulo str. Sao Paulo = ATCC 700523 TaxID=1249483 RepID=A0A5E8H737_9LEPT|nr:hypothetical protein [Leptospira yanagawae]EOQ87105.1 hypothetical protein LEP1GSC202_0359 [Leptospira yanagawae serovar Saopaulo str. Sao Paulo = ATCC 700523]
MKIKKIITLNILIFGMFLNCDLQKSLLVVDIQELSKLNRNEIETKYGKPIHISNDKSIKYDQVYYSINENEVYIEFEKNKPIWIFLQNPKKAKFESNPLVYFNLDAYSPYFENKVTKRWKNVPGFIEVSAVANSNGGLTQISFNISRKF